MHYIYKITLPILFGLSLWSNLANAMSSPIEESGIYSFAVYTLSQGKGVPKSARTVMKEADVLVESLRQRGRDIRITRQRIGLEGETHLCVEFSDARLASTVLQKIQTLAQGVELVNVMEESCKPYRFP